MYVQPSVVEAAIEEKVNTRKPQIFFVYLHRFDPVFLEEKVNSRKLQILFVYLHRIGN